MLAVAEYSFFLILCPWFFLDIFYLLQGSHGLDSSLPVYFVGVNHPREWENRGRDPIRDAEDSADAARKVSEEIASGL